MSNAITLVDHPIGGTRTVVASLTNTTSVSITMNSSGQAQYASTNINIIEAVLDADLTVTVTPLTSGNPIGIAGSWEIYPSTSQVTGGLIWRDRGGSPGLDLTFSVPSTTYDYVDWILGSDAPVVKLKVKITRRA